ncbi:uncharacterized protein TNCV_4685761 [Trichonephila clavipes]|nr:uncharacterized protein TNCV_4685761 [Trichonephila clavipes]
MTDVNQEPPRFAFSVNAETFVRKTKNRSWQRRVLKNKCLLSTALILVKDKYSEWQTFRALLDSGSETCLISNECANKLRLKTERINTLISCLNDASMRIVWCESEHESPKIYELSTVTYGTVSAPYLAQRTLTQLSMDEEANFPIAASVLRNNLYMDDVLCGAATLEEAIVLRQQLKGILKSAGMELHKLCANHEKLSPDPEQNYNFATLTETKTAIGKTCERVVAALQLETAEVYLWSDSMIVLAWLRKEPMDLKTFVQNRVAKIQRTLS